MRYDYIDISKHQGTLDFKAIKPYVDGVMIRAGFGWYNADPKFSEYVRGCENNGIPWGAYFFTYATNITEAKKEMTGFLKHMKGYLPSLPVAIDMEDDGYKKKHGNPSFKDLANILAYECAEVEKAGYYTMIYSSRSWVDQFYKLKPDLKHYDLWLAHWYDPGMGPSMPCGIWQYATRKLQGKKIDANYAYRDYPRLIQEKGFNGFKKEAKANKKKPLTDRYLICYIHDGDNPSAVALLNAMTPLADVELRHGQPESDESRCVIQVGGAAVVGADVKIGGKDRTEVLANIGDFVTTLRR